MLKITPVVIQRLTDRLHDTDLSDGCTFALVGPSTPPTEVLVFAAQNVADMLFQCPDVPLPHPLKVGDYVEFRDNDTGGLLLSLVCLDEGWGVLPDANTTKVYAGWLATDPHAGLLLNRDKFDALFSTSHAGPN